MKYFYILYVYVHSEVITIFMDFNLMSLLKVHSATVEQISIDLFDILANHECLNFSFPSYTREKRHLLTDLATEKVVRSSLIRETIQLENNRSSDNNRHLIFLESCIVSTHSSSLYFFVSTISEKNEQVWTRNSRRDFTLGSEKVTITKQQ